MPKVEDLFEKLMKELFIITVDGVQSIEIDGNDITLISINGNRVQLILDDELLGRVYPREQRLFKLVK